MKPLKMVVQFVYFKNSIIVLINRIIMKYILSILIFSVICPLFVTAQPVITKDILGKPGDMIANAESDQIPDVSPIGANVVWDFSTLTYSDTAIFIQQFVDPDTTEFFADFPTANTCLFTSFIDPDAGLVKGYSYGLGSDNAWDVLGDRISGDFGTISTTYSDPQRIISFPLEFEQGSSDSYAGEIDLIAIKTQFAGESTLFVDAWGTVILPDATVDNCLRMKEIISQTDTTDLGAGIIEEEHLTTTSWLWLHQDHPGPLAVYEVSEFYSIGIFPPLPNDTSAVERDTSFSWDPTFISSGVPYFSVDAFDLNISPNPFSSQITIEYHLDNPEKMKFELYNMSGQQIHSVDLQGVTGVNRETIELSKSIATGSYTALIRGEDAGSAVQIVKGQ